MNTESRYNLLSFSILSPAWYENIKLPHSLQPLSTAGRRTLSRIEKLKIKDMTPNQKELLIDSDTFCMTMI